MSESQNITEILQFYVDNGLDEIISEKSQNHFEQEDKKTAIVAAKFEEKVAQKEVEEKPKLVANNFVNPVNSTFAAISNLAKKSQFGGSMTSRKQDTKFTPLNDIIAKAKDLAQNTKNLDELRKVVEEFDGCNLKKMATNTVFCDGSPDSKVMVIGEAPGNHEDLQGIPFCGDSGKVLDAMFDAINMSRAKDIYITNVIFWRPPGNRRPTDEELAICRPFVERHIQLLNPEVLVLVGATSMSAVLGINDPVSKVRGKFMDFSPEFLDRTIKTFTIFHPSYLMRQPGKKRIAWQDMLALEEFLKN